MSDYKDSANYIFGLPLTGGKQGAPMVATNEIVISWEKVG